MTVQEYSFIFVLSKETVMNILSIEKRTQIVSLLVEGNSLRACSRIADVSFNTVLKLLVTIGYACEQFHNDTVVGVESKLVQCDEIWSFVYAKEKNVTEEMIGAGDAWTWVGMDATNKLVISWYVGDRDAVSANVFMRDLAKRLKSRVQLTTDGHRAYLEAVDRAFDCDIDFAQLVKIYGTDPDKYERRYSQPECIGTKKNVVSGNPDLAEVSTSYIERQNLTMRMGIRRFTRLTNAFSKKMDNHYHALAIHYVYNNFCRKHTTLKTTPAIAAGLTKDIMTIGDMVKLSEIYPVDSK